VLVGLLLVRVVLPPTTEVKPPLLAAAVPVLQQYQLLPQSVLLDLYL